MTTKQRHQGHKNGANCYSNFNKLLYNFPVINAKIKVQKCTYKKISLLCLQTSSWVPTEFEQLTKNTKSESGIDINFKTFLHKMGITEEKYSEGSLEAQAKLVEAYQTKQAAGQAIIICSHSSFSHYLLSFPVQCNLVSSHGVSLCCFLLSIFLRTVEVNPFFVFLK